MEREGRAGSAQRVSDSETLCDPVTVGTCHHTFVQTHRMCHTKSDPDVD